MLNVRYAIRSLVRAPWYSSAVIGVIALTMALAITVFAVVDGVLFKPLPFPDTNRLFVIQPGFSEVPVPQYPPTASPVDVANWQAAAPDALITAARAQPWIGLGQKANENPIGVGNIQRNFFDVLGVRPLVGGFSDGDFDHEDRVWPVVITYDYWQGHFDGDPAAIGRVVIDDPLRGRGYHIVGIMPRGFVFPTTRWNVSLITPFFPGGDRDARNPSLRLFTEVIARLPETMTLQALRARVDAGTQRTAEVFPPQGPKPQGWSDRGWRQQGPFDRADLRPLASVVGGRERPLFVAIFLAASVLIVIGALNVSGLMAARWLDRDRELALRRVLGAAGREVARLVFLEAFVLTAAGSMLGLAIAAPLLRFGAELLPEELVLVKPAAIDWRVAAFALMTIGLVSTLSSIWPIRRAMRFTGPTDGAARTTDRIRSSGRTAVVVAQVGGAAVLTVVGALVVGSILTVYAHTLPIQTGGVVVLEARLLGAGGINQKLPERTTRVMALLDRLRAIPGVRAAAVTSSQLLKGGSWQPWFREPAGTSPARLEIDRQAVTSDFYGIIRPQLTAGRLPTRAELASDARVIVVSESVAKKYWPGRSAIGEPLTEWAMRDVLGDTYTVVGIVKDVRWFGWDRESGSVYGSYSLMAREPFPTFLIQVQGHTGRVIEEALRVLPQTDPLAQFQRVALLKDLFLDSVRPRRFQSWLFGSFAAAALVVVSVGLLGLLAMTTSRRTREIGIRYALGAKARTVIGLMLREQSMAVIAGLLMGAVISGWVARFLRSYLYEITVYDPRVWAAALVTVVATAAIGILIPSIRASRVNPVEALRVD